MRIPIEGDFDIVVNKLRDNPILKDYGVGIMEIQNILLNWCEPHRFYHNITHLINLFDNIESIRPTRPQDADFLDVVALFHDVVYDPRRQDNEEASCDLFRKYFRESLPLVTRIILDTKHHHLAEDPLSELFCRLDVRPLFNPDPVELLDQEYRLFKEHQFLPLKEYCSKRLQFLSEFEENWRVRKPQISINVETIKSFWQHRRLKLGLFAGSFNPFHIGHQDILEKAEELFDKVIVARGLNPGKEVDPRARRLSLKLLSNTLPFHQIIDYMSLLPDLLRSLERDSDITLVRSLRNDQDLRAETQMLRYIQDSHPGVKVVYLPCTRELEHVSSSAIRGLMRFSLELVEEKYLPLKYSYARPTDVEMP